MTSIERAKKLLRAVSDPQDDVPVLLQHSLLDSESVVRHVAAIELARKWPASLPEPAIRELLGTLAQCEYGEAELLESQYEEVTATEDDCPNLGQDIVLAFANLECGKADYAIPRLLEFWSLDQQFYELGHALIALAFPKSPAPVTAPKGLGTQTRVLKALVESEGIWRGDGDWGELLESHGLPADRQAMYRFLEYR